MEEEEEEDGVPYDKGTAFPQVCLYFKFNLKTTIDREDSGVSRL